MPKLKLHMRMADADFARFRQTLKELGRQLLASRAGLLRLNLRSRRNGTTRWTGATTTWAPRGCMSIRARAWWTPI